MTTPDLRTQLGDRYTPVIETITALVHDDESDPQSGTCPVCRLVAERVFVASLPAILPDLLATAWDEGYVASATDDVSGVITPNPYRTKETR